MTNNRFSNFADMAASGRFAADIAETFDGAFIEHNELAKMSIIDEPSNIAMPDSDQAHAMIEQTIGAVFDCFRDTRMEEFGQQIVWGMINSFHMTARMAEGREDDAAKKLGDLARTFDPSEIYATEMEETQILVQTLQGCREAMEAMRDYADRCYLVETGRPFQPTRGSKIARNGITASQIEARDLLAARAQAKREQYNPTGPVVIVSGSQDWTDHEMIWDRLDSIKARIPHMVIASTGMRKGVDKITSCWAANRNVSIINFIPNTKLGAKAAFIRNDKMIELKPVEALIADGTGIQQNLAQKLRASGVPVKIFLLKNQSTKAAQTRAA